MSKPIDNYMTMQEAAHRWGISPETIRNRFKPSITPNEKINQWIEDGLIKSFTAPGKTNKVWIISTDFMTNIYGAEPK